MTFIDYKKREWEDRQINSLIKAIERRRDSDEEIEYLFIGK